MPVVEDEGRGRKVWLWVAGIGCGGCLLVLGIIVLLLGPAIWEIYRALGTP